MTVDNLTSRSSGLAYGQPLTLYVRLKQTYMSNVKECRDKEFYAYGTTRIFERRARRLRLCRTWITFLGIVAPLLVGGLVLTFGVAEKTLPYFITAAGFVGIIQLTLSTWAIVARWDEQYEYSIESARQNTDLYNQFKLLADENPPDIGIKFEKIQKENKERDSKFRNCHSFCCWNSRWWNVSCIIV